MPRLTSEVMDRQRKRGFLPIPEVARLANVTPSTVYKRLRNNTLAADPQHRDHWGMFLFVSIEAVGAVYPHAAKTYRSEQEKQQAATRGQAA